MRIRPPIAPGIVLTAMLSFAAAAFAQQPLGPTPHRPDLLGIYPGMPLNEARAQLQKHSADVYVQDNLPQGFGLTIPDPENPDIVTVFVTQAPNDPTTVWKITRSGGGAMTVTSLTASLRAKYGTESFVQDRGGGGLYLYWIFDPNGNLVAHADPALAACSSISYVNEIKSGPESGNSVLTPCYTKFFAVVAFMNHAPGQEMFRGYEVTLINLPYAVKASLVTANAKNAAGNEAQQEEMRKASHNAPKF